MRGDLTVRINDGERDRHVTGTVRDLRFRKTAPGGHHSASMRLVLPRGTFRDLGPADKLYIYDGSTSRTIWEGYTENPGITDGPQGEEYDLSAIGGMVLASDESRALFYIDRAYDQWEPENTSVSVASGTVQASAHPLGTISGEGNLLQINPGQPIATNGGLRAIYLGAVKTGQHLGAIRFGGVAGKTDTGYALNIVYSNSGGVQSSQIAPLSGIDTTDRSYSHWVGADVGGLGSSVTRFAVQMNRTGGATNVADNNTWAWFHDFRVAAARLNRYGVEASTSAEMVTPEYVRADWVAEDLLGRVLGACDPASAVIEAASYQIDQLAYFEGATAQQVFDDLALYEPDFLWEILASNSTGRHRFNYRKWPTTPRYEISVKDGYSAPGGDADLCNRIMVYWTDSRGRQQATTVTQTVEALGSRIRDAESITLPDGLGSTANATRIGQQVLAAKANPPKAATATVSRRIVDHLTNATVMPWEIEPGYLVRVRETGDDLRLTEMEYVDSEGAATLTLGEPTLTVEQRIARLSNRR